ncbi:chaplin [Streptomyces sp. NBC_01190]|uniref:chaplin n=1 Tax=Streptomyces sp. NBC_01190 TaxID=2903767 RepID=UPI003863000E|nr:chaplin [Streptomyces sp. NBC_01190]
MRQILNWSLFTVAAAGSVLAISGGYASADSAAEGVAAGSPGLLSGNSVQTPVDAPVNVCGNTVDATAVANPAFGNQCANTSQRPAGAHSTLGAGAVGSGVTKGSPGVLSGNSVDIPVSAPVNACGNTADAASLLSPALGNSCVNDEQSSSIHQPGQVPPPAVTPPHTQPPQTGTPPAGETPPVPQVHTPGWPAPAPPAQPGLAETGFDSRAIGAAGATSAALLLGGAMLYRRGARPAHAGHRR